MSDTINRLSERIRAYVLDPFELRPIRTVEEYGRRRAELGESVPLAVTAEVMGALDARPPATDPRDAELALLRAEVADLRAQLTAANEKERLADLKAEQSRRSIEILGDRIRGLEAKVADLRTHAEALYTDLEDMDDIRTGSVVLRSMAAYRRANPLPPEKP